MKKILLLFIGIFWASVSINADKITVKIPLDIDALPNSGYIIDPRGAGVHLRHVQLSLEMVGCNDERKFKKFIPLTDRGIHQTITIEKTFVTECGHPRPQITVHLYFTNQSIDTVYSAAYLGTGKSSLKPLITTNTNAVRGYCSKVE